MTTVVATTAEWLNVTDIEDDRTAKMLAYEAVIRVVVPVVFSVIAVLGFVGNLSVIIVVVANLQMRSTTNTLIISLAVADLLFIVICVPFTAVSYVISVWPFGTAWCMVSSHYSHKLSSSGANYKKILRLSYDVIITYDNRKSNLR